MGLDRDKRKIDGIGSNMAHCLWTGIVDEEKAAAVAATLVAPDMFTGWGIRTLSNRVHCYNPLSYHCGSVWPHDNAIAAAGLMRYGFVDEAHLVMLGLVEASAWFGDLLPELFSGMPRTDIGFPVPYPTSCSPQAWAAAAPLPRLPGGIGACVVMASRCAAAGMIDLIRSASLTSATFTKSVRIVKGWP